MKERKILRDMGRKRKSNMDSEYVALSSEDSEEGRSSASERTMSETETEMVQRRTERRKRRYGFYRYHPSSSRRQDRASLSGRAGKKTPTPSTGSRHSEHRPSGSYFSMESRVSVYGRRETAAVRGSSRGTRMGILVGDGIEFVSDSVDLQSEGRTGDSVKEAAQIGKSAQSAGPGEPRPDPDFLTCNKILYKELGLQTSSDDQTQIQEDEEEGVQVLHDHRRAFRATESKVPRPASVQQEMFEDEVFELGAQRPEYAEASQRVEAKNPAMHCDEAGSDPDHADYSSSETVHGDEDYSLGLSENDVSEISLSDENGIPGDEVDKAGCGEDH